MGLASRCEGRRFYAFTPMLYGHEMELRVPDVSYAQPAVAVTLLHLERPGMPLGLRKNFTQSTDLPPKIVDNAYAAYAVNSLSAGLLLKSCRIIEETLNDPSTAAADGSDRRLIIEGAPAWFYPAARR